MNNWFGVWQIADRYSTLHGPDWTAQVTHTQFIECKPEDPIILTIPSSQYYEHVEEAEWHVEAVKKYMPGVPVCASLCINETSDVHGIPTGECGVKLARAGADVVGINCHYDPFRCLEATKKMVKSVKEAGFDKVGHCMSDR